MQKEAGEIPSAPPIAIINEVKMKARVLSLSWVRTNSIKASNSIFIAICLSFSLSLVAFAGPGIDKDKDKKNVAGEVEVKNFGKVNDHIYRGGQPEENEYEQLASVGIKMVIDLRNDARSSARKKAKSTGMNYINIRLDDKRPPTIEESNLFLSLVNDQSNWPVFVHCRGGRHRTGVLIAVYRMEMDGWNVKQAYDEMKEFKFYSRFGHDEMKDYVYDYYRKLFARRADPSSTTRARRVTERSR
jgi:protein tyrosine/serine phosphatase